MRQQTSLPLAAALLAASLTSPPAFAENLIPNPEFSDGMQPWWSIQDNGAEMKIQVVDGELCTTVASPGAFPWNVVIGTNDINMPAGRQYEVSFVAYADAPRTINFKTGKGSSPYTDYFLKPVNITTVPENYRYSFMNTVEDAHTQFQFHVGGAVGKICIDNVSLTAVTSPVDSITPHVTPSLTGRSLRDYNSIVTMGCALNTNLFASSPEHNSILAGEFGSLTPANAMKMGNLVPTRGEYMWSTADAMVDFAAKNAMAIHGHALVWHTQQPEWLLDGSFNRDDMLQIMNDHIDLLMGRYAGRVKHWDVVNEAISYLGTEENPDYSASDYRSTIWRDRIGPDYIELAFRRARAADPNAVLLYNDFSIEEEGDPKADFAYNMVKDLVARGVPVDAVGFQMHLLIEDPPDFAAIRSNMARYAGLGVDVQITEIDVRMRQPATAADFAVQAQLYRNSLEACVQATNCDSFTTWGFGDTESWVPDYFPGYGTAHLFDAQNRPRSAYQELVDVLNIAEQGTAAAPNPTSSAPASAGADSGGCSLATPQKGSPWTPLQLLIGAALTAIATRGRRAQV